MNKERLFLEHKAYKMRANSLLMTAAASSGHPTSCLSAADLVAALFFHAMQFDPKNFTNPHNDRFILSKGHAAPLLYTAWHEVGAISEKDLFTYRKIDSDLEGHPTLRFPYAEAATGALGIGLSIGVGMALSARLDGFDFKTYVLLGDGECAAGCIWEAAELAHFYKLNNLIAILDCNRLGQSDETVHGHHTHRYEEKFAAFGWKTFVVDGHNMQQITDTLDKAKKIENLPVIIIAKTFKGHGVKNAEDKLGFHGKAFKEDVNELVADLEKQFPEAVAFTKKEFTWKPQLPEDNKSDTPVRRSLGEGWIGDPAFDANDTIPTRKAYGLALKQAGGASKQVVALDGDVKNSTFSELFEKKYPKRFFQSFIAEQNMVGMATGLDRCGKIPFVSTFGAFMSRAHDQIRMAAIGQAQLKLVGSHAGVSIGKDGPSQMGLEDIAMMRALPGSAVLYPSDAVSTWKLVEQMGNYSDGICYLRTTRMATPVLYENSETFQIGGCKILQQSQNDKACVVAAGVTVHEALKAYNILQEKGITIAVIDLYSIKPFDEKTVLEVAKKAGGKLITVEDHYVQGGLGQAVAAKLCNVGVTITNLAVKKLPRSGKSEELLAWAGIDADAIVRAVQNI